MVDPDLAEKLKKEIQNRKKEELWFTHNIGILLKLRIEEKRNYDLNFT